MRIGADGSWMRWQRTGLGNYLSGLLHALAGVLAADEQLSVYYNSLPGDRLFDPPVQECFVRMPTPTLWNQVALPAALARDGIDVYLGGANIIPYVGRSPRVVVFHDCLPFRVPEAYDFRYGRYYRRWFRASARRATRVISDSEWSAAECGRFLGIPRDRIDVIPGGVDPRFTPLDPSITNALRRDLASRLGVAGRFVLQVGGSLHKGGGTAVQAVNLVAERGIDVRLVRCGAPGPFDRLEGALQLGYVDDATLLALYQCAAVVCVASEQEGFGLPLLEAMACGTPVVATRAASLPEVGGDVALYADAGSPESMADAIQNLLEDGTEAARRSTAGVLRARDFNWERTANAVHRVLRSAASSAGS